MINIVIYLVRLMSKGPDEIIEIGKGRRNFLKIAVTGVAALAVGDAAGFYAREGEVALLRNKVEELSSQLGTEIGPVLEKNLNI